jgi:hypothetical protein
LLPPRRLMRYAVQSQAHTRESQNKTCLGPCLLV